MCAADLVVTAGVHASLFVGNLRSLTGQRASRHILLVPLSCLAQLRGRTRHVMRRHTRCCRNYDQMTFSSFLFVPGSIAAAVTVAVRLDRCTDCAVTRDVVVSDKESRLIFAQSRVARSKTYCRH